MKTEKINLAVIFGGRSGEHAVSLMSARSVLEALDPHKYNIFQIGITQAGVWKTGENVLEAFEIYDTEKLDEAVLMREKDRVHLFTRSGKNLKDIAPIDVIFPVLHGTFGEDGTIQGMFEILGVAYVGAGVLGSAVAMDKAVCKRVVQSLGIPTLEFGLFTRAEIRTSLGQVADKAEKIAPFPLFVKPVNLGSSVGISKVTNRMELEAGLEKAAQFDRRVIVERGINAREIEISILGNETPESSAPGEIFPGDVFYTYEDKYHHGDPEVAIPAPLSAELTAQLQDYALQAYQAADCAGMARVDFLLDKESGKAYFSEINTIPGFTRISMYAKLWKNSGVSYAQLVDRLIALALARKADGDATIRKFEASHDSK